jgi:hypothetical protein
MRTEPRESGVGLCLMVCVGQFDYGLGGLGARPREEVLRPNNRPGRNQLHQSHLSLSLALQYLGWLYGCGFAVHPLPAACCARARAHPVSPCLELLEPHACRGLDIFEPLNEAESEHWPVRPFRRVLAFVPVDFQDSARLKLALSALFEKL